MNTASPRIPSPLETAGMTAVVSAPGLAGQGTARRELAGGDREEKTPSSAEEPSRPRGGGGGRAGWRAGGRQAAAPPPVPSLPSAVLSYQPSIGLDYCHSDSGSPLPPASSLIGCWTKARCYDWPSGQLFPFAGREGGRGVARETGGVRLRVVGPPPLCGRVRC